MSVSAKAPNESNRGRFRCRDPPGEVGPADSESVSSSSPLAHEARRWTVSSRGIPGEVNALDSSSKLRYSGSGIGGKRKHEPNARADGSPPHAINMHPHVIPARMHTIGNVSGTNKRKREQRQHVQQTRRRPSSRPHRQQQPPIRAPHTLAHPEQLYCARENSGNNQSQSCEGQGTRACGDQQVAQLTHPESPRGQETAARPN